ncbi:hypothetical protein GQR58_026344 [Nymphon striatum]|nr:hypothetical protein GQR58_026344 [Nymphon striatum]
MPNIIALNSALQFVNPFSGTDPKFSIQKFLEEVDNIVHLVQLQDNEQAKLLILKTKLVGEAKDYLCQVEEPGTKYQQAAFILRDRFGRSQSTKESIYDVAECRQKLREDVANKIKRKVYGIIQVSDIGTVDELSKFRGKFLLEMFINGLQPKLMSRVLQQSPKTFDDAVQEAIKSARIEEQLKSTTQSRVMTIETKEMIEPSDMEEFRGLMKNLTTFLSTNGTYNQASGINSGASWTNPDSRIPTTNIASRQPRKEYLQPMNRGECYHCGQPGHFARPSSMEQV